MDTWENPEKGQPIEIRTSNGIKMLNSHKELSWFFKYFYYFIVFVFEWFLADFGRRIVVRVPIVTKPSESTFIASANDFALISQSSFGYLNAQSK